jgi:hypothetical protein
MLYPKLTNCKECEEIPSLLKKIDCSLNLLAVDLYNNSVFMLNRSINQTSMLKLLNYKRILTARYCNDKYALPFSIKQIANRINQLTLGCKSKCNTIALPKTTTTTTTVAAPTTTTTTTLLCTSYRYGVTYYDCDTCVSLGGDLVRNEFPLTIGKWYTWNGFKIHIDNFNQCSIDQPTSSILDSSAQDTCAAVVCPITTTTTTTTLI